MRVPEMACTVLPRGAYRQRDRRGEHPGSRRPKGKKLCGINPYTMGLPGKIGGCNVKMPFAFSASVASN